MAMDLLESWNSLHAVVFPYPEQGHINPLLLLSIQLAFRGSTVTFVNTHQSHLQMLQSRSLPSLQQQGLNIRFVTIPEADDISPDVPPAIKLFQRLESIKKQKTTLQQIIADLKHASPPVSCIISDSFFPWTAEVASNLKIARVLFWASSATVLYLAISLATERLRIEVPNATSESAKVFESLPFRDTDLPTLIPLVADRKWCDFLKERFHDIENAACILCNSFCELEGTVIRAIPLQTPVRTVGPLLPFHVGDKESIEAQVGGSLFREDEDCMSWLDLQPTDSVLYVSFGSMCSLSSAQLEQLALGLEASKQRFLWVIRGGTRGSVQLPEGFIDRTRDIGLISTWAPQLRVLSHRAVGGFLTHCGWNSTLESISMGLPMLCWPFFGDQPLNGKLIVQQWQIGVGLERREDGVVEADEVERVVREMMMGSEEMRNRAAHMRHAARDALKEGGSSYNDMEALLQDIKASFNSRNPN